MTITTNTIVLNYCKVPWIGVGHIVFWSYWFSGIIFSNVNVIHNRCLAVLESHYSVVTSLAFSHCGQYVVR